MTDSSIPTDLETLRARERSATPAPWTADTVVRGDCVVWGPDGQFVANTQSEPHWVPNADGSQRQVMFDVDRGDAELIAAVRNQLPGLLAELANHRQVGVQTRRDPVEPDYDAEAVERAAAELDNGGQGGDRLGDVVRNLAAILDRRTAALAVAEKIARDSGFELARQSPTVARARGWERRAEAAEAALEWVRMLCTDPWKVVLMDASVMAFADHIANGLGNPPAPARADGHVYLGTYCIHGLHDQCKRTCKTCASPCVRPCGHPAPTVPAPADESWRQYTVERDNSDDGVSVLCREDGDCMENSGEDGVAAGRYLTLGEAVDWAKAHAVSIFHVDPDACDTCGHDPIECSCELTAADAPVAFGPAQVDKRSVTAAYDDLRRHLAAAHCDGMAIGRADADALDVHQYEHDSPGTIRNHDRTDLSWDPVKLEAVRAEFAEAYLPCSTCNDTGWIHQEGQVGAPGSGCTHGCPDCTVGRERLAAGDLHEDDRS